MRTGYILIHIFLLVFCAGAYLTASAVEPERKEVSIRRGNRDYNCLLLRSQLNPSQWFCMLTNPYLAEYQEGRDTHPYLWYYRFQRLDPRNPNRLQDFGILRCGFVMFPPEEVRKSLVSRIPRVGGRPVSLSMLPADAMELRIKPPGRKPVIGIASVSRAIGGVLEQERTDFLVTLVQNDADLADNLLLDKTGVDFELTARLAPRGDLSWKEKFAAEPSPAAKVESRDTTKHEFSLPAASSAPGKRDWRRTVPSRQQILDKTRASGPSTAKTAMAKSQRALQENRQLERERSAQRVACKGFFTFLPYPEAVRREHMILEEAQEDWRCTYFVLPLIQVPDSIDIESIAMKVSLIRGKDEYSRQTVTWKPDTKWRDEDRLPKTVLRFSLKDLLAGAGDPLADSRFRVVTTVAFDGRDKLESIEETPVVTGDIPLANPLSIGDLLTLDVHLLDWTAPADDQDRLTKVEFNLRQAGRTLGKTLQPQKRGNGEIEIPEALVWLVKSGSLETPGSVEANVFFRTASGRRIPWALNGQPREQDFTGGAWYFTDEDWKPAVAVH